MRLLVVVLCAIPPLLLAACHHPPYELWRQQYGFDQYPNRGPFCGVAPNPLSQQHADRLLAWCEANASDKRWFMRVSSQEAFESYAERRGYSSLKGNVQYVNWASEHEGAWAATLNETLFDIPDDTVERILQHEECHADGEYHPKGVGFRVPEQCPVK